MTPDDFASLDLSRYELRLKAQQSATLPPFLGSTLRGAFGHALKETVCVMSHRNCERCMAVDRCIYPYLFETPAPQDVPEMRGQQKVPHPFILTPPISNMSQQVASRIPVNTPERAMTHRLADGRVIRRVPLSATGSNQERLNPSLNTEARQRIAAGQELSFGLLLMGRAIEYLPIIVHAVSKMARHGLGVDRTRFELAEVSMIAEGEVKDTIYYGDSHLLAMSDSAINNLSDLICLRLDRLTASGPCGTGRPRQSLRLKFLTPTRIRVHGDLQTGMNFDLFARNLLRRVSMLAAVHGQSRMELDYRGLIVRAAMVETRVSSLRWFDWERYSNRQHTKMNLGGFTGEVEYCGDAIEEFLPLVAAGELLHVGTGTSFGLGKYMLVE